MSEDVLQPEWPGLEVVGPCRVLGEVEDLLGMVFDNNELLGSARETWHAANPSCGPDDDDACQPEPDAPGVLRVWLARGTDAAEARERLVGVLTKQASVDSGEERVEVRPLSTPDEDWATSWREFFRPIRVSRRVLILPAWWDAPGEALANEANAGPDVVLRIEPGQAFGSGTHATTRLTLRALEEALRPGMRVLDFGAGSGILSFAALRLGAASVTGVEIDPVCLQNFRANAALNGLEGRIDYRIGSMDAFRADERYDLVLCNVLLKRVTGCLPGLAGRLAVGGRLLLSGFLEEQRAEAEDRLRAEGLEIVSGDREEEWGLVEAARGDNR